MHKLHITHITIRPFKISSKLAQISNKVIDLDNADKLTINKAVTITVAHLKIASDNNY